MRCARAHSDLNDEEAQRLAFTDFLDLTSRLGVSGDEEIRYKKSAIRQQAVCSKL
jgi:hypothetical protein